MSHHGAPLNLHDARQRNSSIWRSYGALHPQRQVTRIGQCVRQWFHEAWLPDGPALPSAIAFQHLFTGLCMLADWIGSDETRFPFCAESDGDYMHTARANAHRAARDIGLNPQDQRRTFLSQPCPPDFGRLFNLLNAEENASQEAVTVPPRTRG